MLTVQAVNASVRGGTDAKADQHITNGILAAVTGLAPRDEVEGMLALQMAATHNAAMEMLKRTMLDQTIEVSESLINRATKLLRTYTAQVETLNRYRNAGRQQVIVQHQHVGITADKAVVGINAPGGGAGLSIEMEGLPHATLADAPVPAMWGANPAGDALQVSGCDGAEPMPDAWRGQR